MVGTRLAAVLVLVPVLALADGAKDRAALDRFAAAYEPIGKLSGAARIERACAAATTLYAAGDAIANNVAPPGAPIDNATWYGIETPLDSALDDLVEVCKRPDHRLKHLSGETTSIDEVLRSVDDQVRKVLDAATPRTLPAPLEAARRALTAMLASSKAVCAQQPKLVKALAGAATPPPGVAADVWKAAYDTVTGIADDVRSVACGRHKGAAEQIGSNLNELRERFYDLVLLVPPR